jgi:hypothetical protein
MIANVNGIGQKPKWELIGLKKVGGSQSKFRANEIPPLILEQFNTEQFAFGYIHGNK